MKRKNTPIYLLLSLPELLSSDMQSMFSDVFAQVESGLNLNHSKIGIHDPGAHVTAISTVDKGIDAARQLVRSLLTRRNALMPISRLPPEILARVFHLLVLEDPHFSGERKLDWIEVTHVCRHWRQVALDNSSLWARIPDIWKHTEWISEMLARAKNAPLDIESHAGARPSPEALLMIPPHLSHTRQLRFRNLSTLHSDSIREIFSWEAPALEHFELMVAEDLPQVITFPDLGGNMLFKGHAPRLRTFSLSQLVIPWSLIPRGQLVQLKIAVPQEDVHSPGDLNQLIDLLVNCPALEILALESCLSSQLTEFPHGRTIHLPHLSRLRLCGSTSRIVNILKMIKLPPSAKLHLDCISKITHNDSEVLLLRVISAHFQSPAPVEFKSLTVTTNRHTRTETSSLNIIASTFPFTLNDFPTQNFRVDIVGNPELALSFDELSEPGHSANLLEQACNMLPISNLEFISLSSAFIIDININWAELSSCCTNVTTIQANGPGTSSFVRALTAPTVTNAGPSRQTNKRKYDDSEPASTAHAHAVIFPKLKFLGIADQDFSEHDLTSGMLFDVFERGLQQRMEACGAPLISLYIRHCVMTAKRARGLQELVQYFDWDDIVFRPTARTPGWDSDWYDDYSDSDDYDGW